MDKLKSKMKNILMLLIVNKNNSYLQQLTTFVPALELGLLR